MRQASVYFAQKTFSRLKTILQKSLASARSKGGKREEKEEKEKRPDTWVSVGCATRIVQRVVDLNRGSSTMILSNGWALATRRTMKISSLEGIHGVPTKSCLPNRDPWHVFHISTGDSEPIPVRTDPATVYYIILVLRSLPRPSFLILAFNSPTSSNRFQHATSWPGKFM